MYGRMMGKRFDADFFLQSAADDGTHACDYLLACGQYKTRYLSCSWPPSTCRDT